MKTLFITAAAALLLSGCANSWPERIGVAITDSLSNVWGSTEQLIERSMSAASLGPRAFDKRYAVTLEPLCDKDAGIHVKRADAQLGVGKLDFRPSPQSALISHGKPRYLGSVNGHWDLWQKRTPIAGKELPVARTETRLVNRKTTEVVVYSIDYEVTDAKGQPTGEAQCSVIKLSDLVKAASDVRPN